MMKAQAGAGLGKAWATIHASLLTRCPIHARRVHRIGLSPGADGALLARIERGGPCCTHMRCRRLVIQGAPAWCGAPLRLVLGMA